MQRKSDRHLDVLSTILHPYASTGFDRISRRVSQEQSDWKKLDIYTIWTCQVHNFVTGIVDQLFVNVDFFSWNWELRKIWQMYISWFFFLQSDNIYHGMDGLLFIVLLTSSIFLSLLCVLLYCILFLLNKYYFVQHYIIVVCN